MILGQKAGMIQEIINWIIDNAINLVKEIPLSSLLTGVVVPIVAAWTSYYLAETALKKKGYNRLYVQVELIKRELKINDDIVCKFISSVEEMNQIEKSLEFPLVFVKQFLINTLNSLQEIKSSYMHWEMFIHGSVEGV